MTRYFCMTCEVVNAPVQRPRTTDVRIATTARSRGSVQPIVRSFIHPQSFQDLLVLPDVIITGGQIRPLICTRLQCLFWVLLVDGSNGPLDVHPRAEICDHGVVVVNLGLRPVSDNLACSLKIGVDLVYVHEMSAILLSERQRPGPRDVWIATGARWPGSLQRPLRITIGIEPRTLIGLWV